MSLYPQGVSRNRFHLPPLDVNSIIIIAIGGYIQFSHHRWTSISLIIRQRKLFNIYVEISMQIKSVSVILSLVSPMAVANTIGFSAATPAKLGCSKMKIINLEGVAWTNKTDSL
ncbi:hypothetical protein F5884DRAFT_808263, partial [Xylogone sp. PMI_703]